MADTDEIMDHLVATALEAVVNVAAAGARAPAVPRCPPALKPYLKVSKLSAKARADVRRALDADDDYRSWAATVVPDEMLDDAGALWLRRPSGWEKELAAMSVLPDEVDTVTALRREQRRRESAEQLARRAVAEQAVLRVTNESLLETVAAAKAELDALRLDRDALNKQVHDRATDVRHGQDKLRAALERVERSRADVEAAEARAVEAERTRDAVLADRARHLGSAMDEAMVLAGAESVAETLAAQIALAGKLGDTLAGAVAQLRALEPATRSTNSRVTTALPSRGRRRSNAARRPIGMPGGVYGSSVEAAQFLVRYDGVVVLVDGYNVAKLGWPALTLEEQRECCVQAAEDVARRFGTAVHVVFDGADVEGAATTVRRLVRVQFSPEGVIADDVLRAEVAALADDKPVVVVTNDQALIADLRAAGANIVSSEHWLAVAGRRTL